MCATVCVDSGLKQEKLFKDIYIALLTVFYVLCPSGFIFTGRSQDHTVHSKSDVDEMHWSEQSVDSMVRK